MPKQSGIEQSSTPDSMQASIAFRASVEGFLAPVEIDERNDPIGARASAEKHRCSDKGFIAMPTAAYMELLDWTARQIVTGKTQLQSFVKREAQGGVVELRSGCVCRIFVVSGEIVRAVYNFSLANGW